MVPKSEIIKGPNALAQLLEVIEAIEKCTVTEVWTGGKDRDPCKSKKTKRYVDWDLFVFKHRLKNGRTLYAASLDLCLKSKSEKRLQPDVVHLGAQETWTRCHFQV